MADNVNDPKHYQGKSGHLDVITVCEEFELGLHLGCAVQYILRAGRKDSATEIEDIQKAIWYLKRYIHDQG